MYFSKRLTARPPSASGCFTAIAGELALTPPDGAVVVAVRDGAALDVVAVPGAVAVGVGAAVLVAVPGGDADTLRGTVGAASTDCREDGCRGGD